MEAIANWTVAVLTTTTTARAGGQRRKGAKEKDQDRGKKTNEVPNEREGERDGEREHGTTIYHRAADNRNSV